MPKVVANETILEAALATILAYGYEGATTRLIAAAANINEVTLFRRFGTKDALIILAVKQELAAFQQADIRYTGDLHADLVDIVEFYAAVFRERARLIPIIISELPRNHELRAGLSELAPIADGLTTIIARYQSEAKLQQELPLATLMALLAPVLTYYLSQHLGLAHNSEFNPADHVHVFLHGRAYHAHPESIASDYSQKH